MTASRAATRPAVGILAGLRVVDASGPEGAYGARLLADLGADVVRVDTSGSAAAMCVPPLLTAADGTVVSTFERFVNLNKRSVRLDEDHGDTVLRELVAHADVVLTDGTVPLSDLPGTTSRVDVSGFGQVGAGRHLIGDDLVNLAAGGLLSLGGYPDTEPIAVFGSQSYLAGGLLAAIAALLATLARDADGAGHQVDVSVQAGIVGALEDATAEADLVGTTRTRAGERPREAGTGTFPCADGHVAMVAGKMGTARAWDSLVSWLREVSVPGADELADPVWTTLTYRRRPESIATFTAVFESFTARHPKSWLYHEGQRRGIPIAPVNTITDLLGDEQLLARNYFRTVFDPLLQTELTYPGPPFRMHGHRAQPWRGAPSVGADTTAVFAEWLGRSGVPG